MTATTDRPLHIDLQNLPSADWWARRGIGSEVFVDNVLYQLTEFHWNLVGSIYMSLSLREIAPPSGVEFQVIQLDIKA